jgi:hypothetical protein
MEINLTQDEVRQFHPEMMQQLIAKLRGTNNRDTQTPLNQCQFYYSYGQSVHAQNLDELFRSDAAAPNLTQNPKINQLLRTVIGLSLAICAGRTRRYVIFNHIPAQFIEKFSAKYAADILKFEEEERRWAQLTEEQRLKEVKDEVESAVDSKESLLGLNIGADLIKQAQSRPVELSINDVLDKLGRVGFDKLTDAEKKFLELQ